MPSVETVGTDERESLMSDGCGGRCRNYLEKVLKMSVVTVVRVISLKGRGGHFSTLKRYEQRCRPFVYAFCVFERGIKHPIVKFL